MDISVPREVAYGHADEKTPYRIRQAGALWWEYMVAQPLSGELTVTVFASDLPGHVTQASEKKSIPG